MKNAEPKIRKQHHHRDDLIGEHPWGDLGQLILLLFFLIVWISDSFIFHYSTFLFKAIPLYLRIPCGCFFLVCAGYLARKGLRIVFGEIREGPMVIREGVFNVVRHPIYLGAILVYVGLFIFTGSLATLLVLIIIFLFYFFIADYEEKLLLQYFGSDYEKYKRAVPMLFPKFIKKNKK
jgi:protein-S-isoprenylcysteine O-methyltransferase Ste14